MESKVVDIVVYHAPCVDGTCAAWVAYCYHSTHSLDIPDFLPWNLRSSVLQRDMFVKKRVLLLDMAWSREQLEQVAALASSLLVLDHHETNERALHGLDFARFDMQRSGCQMAWDHFFPLTNRPPVVDAIGARDLWRHKGTNAEAFMAAFDLDCDSHLQEWNVCASDKFYDETLAKGRTILQYHQKLVKSIAKAAAPADARNWTVGGITYSVVCANVGHPFVSDVGAELALQWPSAVILLWSHNGSGFSVSLRSHSERGPNVATIAEYFGGGGHAHAAGLRTDQLPLKFFDN